jgi:hypothetical protein
MVARSKHVSTATRERNTMEERFSTRSVTRCFKQNHLAVADSSRVEAGSNTSTVILRVVGGDEKWSVESKTVKYGHGSHGTRTRKWLRWRGPGALTNNRPVLSSERESPYQQTRNCLTVTKDLVLSPRWVLYSKTDWPTDRQTDSDWLSCNYRTWGQSLWAVAVRSW